MRRAEGLRRWGGWRGRHGWHERRTARLLVGLGRPGCGQPDQQQKKGTRARTPAPTPRPSRRNVGLGRKCLRQHASCAPHNSRWAGRLGKAMAPVHASVLQRTVPSRAELVASTPSPECPTDPALTTCPTDPADPGRAAYSSARVAWRTSLGLARLDCAAPARRRKCRRWRGSRTAPGAGFRPTARSRRPQAAARPRRVSSNVDSLHTFLCTSSACSRA